MDSPNDRIYSGFLIRRERGLANPNVLGFHQATGEVSEVGDGGVGLPLDEIQSFGCAAVEVSLAVEQNGAPNSGCKPSQDRFLMS